MAARAPKQWQLTRSETLNSFTNWKENLVYTLSFLLMDIPGKRKQLQIRPVALLIIHSHSPADARQTAVKKMLNSNSCLVKLQILLLLYQEILL